MTLADIDPVVHIHLCSFKGFFLSFMGPFFLREFYKSALLDKTGIALISIQTDKVSGFAVGTTEPHGFFRRIILNNWHHFLAASIIPVLKKPQTLFRLARRLLSSIQSNYSENETLLLSIAIHPANQGQGIGKQLIESFSTEAKIRGATSISLTTDKLNNDMTNQFYIRSGFNCTGSFTTKEERQMNEYRKYL